MNKLCENTNPADFDSDQEDPEQLLDEWLGQLDNLTEGLNNLNTSNNLKPSHADICTPRIDSYRFSMANLEDSQDVDLDAILGELCALESQYEKELEQSIDNKNKLSGSQKQLHQSRTHLRSHSEGPRIKMDSGETDLIHKTDSSLRTDSPDNDSAFSDTVSMLSGESSASSGGSGPKPSTLQLPAQCTQDEASKVKAEKIRMAMEKIKEANIQKLFVKVFTVDGSAKSLLVDEKMTCAYITRLLADKNHVHMDPKWTIVEHLPDLYMERVYEDHELLVENLMVWTRDSKNKIYFAERSDKIKLFINPENFLLTNTDKQDAVDYDEHLRSLLLEDFFRSGNQGIPHIEGPLYLKSESKKGWKKYHFVLRASGLYYFQKEKSKTTKDLMCLATFDVNQVYYGLGWKKKYKAPTDYCFAIKHPRLQEPKSSKYIKYLCAEDFYSLEKWVVGIRVAKHGRQLMDNYRMLVDELAQEDLDKLAHARSCSVSSISVQSSATTPTQGYSSSEGYVTPSETYSATSEASSGRHSRASSSSSSGCMSDSAPSSCEIAFESEFPMGTIKRKPSMKPSLPLTNITRQLKEVGETREVEKDQLPSSSPVLYTNTGTLTRRQSRRKSSSTEDSSNSGTLKRQQSFKSTSSMESIRSNNSTPLCGTPIRDKPLFTEEEFLSPNSLISGEKVQTSMVDSIISLPSPPEVCDNYSMVETSSTYQLPPPPPEVYSSNLSLDSLPPPPNPLELPLVLEVVDLTGSQLSLMSLPPPPTENCDMGNSLRKVPPLSSRLTLSYQCNQTDTMLKTKPNDQQDSPKVVSMSDNKYVSKNEDSEQNEKLYAQLLKQSGGTLPLQLDNNSINLRSSLRQSAVTALPPSVNKQISTNNIITRPTLNTNSPTPQKKVCFQEFYTPKKANKRVIGFSIPSQEAPLLLPKKPPPPKRSETTRLSSPKKLVEPPTDFLKDLQRVMKKKWQVAQKCKLEPTTTPHEVLGFRDPPPQFLPDYKESSVSKWVKEHYGGYNFYENVYRDSSQNVTEYATNNTINHNVRKEVKMCDSIIRNKRPPPPPPKRSETTQLTTPRLH